MDENYRKAMEAESLRDLAKSSIETAKAVKALTARLDSIEQKLSSAPAGDNEALSKIHDTVGRVYVMVSDLSELLEQRAEEIADAEPTETAHKPRRRTAKAGS